MEEKVSKRTKYAYCYGGIGRDMAYTLVSMFLMSFFTDAIGVSDWEIGGITLILTLMNIWDAVNDPLMGVIVDNTRTRWGKFKPWVLIGAITSGICIFLLFQDFGLSGVPFLVVFTTIYFLFEATFTTNDIAYWSMYPAFTSDPKERESIGSLARFTASLGGFIVAGLAARIYTDYDGGPKEAFFLMALVIVLVYILCQVMVVVLVKNKHIDNPAQNEKKMSLKGIFEKVFKNDQLLIILLGFFLFEAGFGLTIGLGLYYFNYDLILYGGGEYIVFFAVLAVGQLASIGTYSLIAKKLSRRQIYFYSMLLITIGYLLFFSIGYLLPVNILFIAIAGFFLFFGQGYIQVMLYVCIADTIEYGEWKLGTRNESAVYAIRPFATKLSSSLKQIIVGVILIVASFNTSIINPLTVFKEANPASTPLETQDMIRTLYEQAGNEAIVRINLRMGMMIVPMILIIISYIVYRKLYRIDDVFYNQIINDLSSRKSLNND
ncbi:MAG: glycoside-pentoside-hexuronide (GPH):cation symporter [Bacilli bacterium]|nr:glycoside-pentoside-hexuronide (GPH):cation symporter [Bacilli bacterium]